MEFSSEIFITWLNDKFVPAAIVVIVAIIVRRMGMQPIKTLVRKAVKTSRFQTEAQHHQREETLLDVSESVFGVLVWIVAIVFILIALEINLEPLLAAGGIAGIVIGFGSQRVLQDLFAGIYVVTENQYQIGDVVNLDGDIGLVEDISLRMTILRDLDGTVHHIPHGSVQRAKNLSKDYARVNINIGVDYSSDLKKVIEVINTVGEELSRDEEWKQNIIAPPKFLRVENFGDDSIDIKIVGETKPLKQWAVAGELRLRLKIAFDKEGIEIPFPQRTIHYAKETQSDE